MIKKYKYSGICEQCGGPTFAEYKSQLKRFCCHKCSNQWKWDRIRAKRHYIKFFCANCGDLVLVPECDHRIKEGQNKFFCSHKCSGEYIRKMNNKICPICGKIFHPQKTQTCSTQCGVELRRLLAYRKREHNSNLTYKEYLIDFQNKKREAERARAERMNRTPVYAGREKEYLKEYNKRNASKRNEIIRQRIKNDKVFALKVFVRKRLCWCVKSKGRCKDSYLERILGCGLNDFITYLLSKHKEGMTLENYGKWQLDHIIPLSQANTVEDVERLCHYSNIQPLWAWENRAKGSKI